MDARPNYIIVENVDVENGGCDEYIVVDGNNPQAMKTCSPNEGVFENEGWAEEWRDELNLREKMICRKYTKGDLT